MDGLPAETKDSNLSSSLIQLDSMMSTKYFLAAGIPLIGIAFILFAFSTTGWSMLLTLTAGALIYGIVLIIFLVSFIKKRRDSQDGNLYFSREKLVLVLLTFFLMLLTSVGDCGDAEGMTLFSQRLLHHIIGLFSTTKAAFHPECLPKYYDSIAVVFSNAYLIISLVHIWCIASFISSIHPQPTENKDRLQINKRIPPILIISILVVGFGVPLLDHKEGQDYFNQERKERENTRNKFISLQQKTQAEIQYPLEISSVKNSEWNTCAASQLSLTDLTSIAEKSGLKKPDGGYWYVEPLRYGSRSQRKKACSWIIRLNNNNNQIIQSVHVEDENPEQIILWPSESSS